jgi:NAD(P)H-hydrate epimerase
MHRMDGRGAAPLVGIDIASVTRVNELLDRRPAFAARVFTEQEQRDCAGHPERWAARWAVKEAVRKLFAASGQPLPGWRDIELGGGRDQPPRVAVHGVTTPLAVSLTHDAGVAVAAVVAALDPLEEPPRLPPPAQLRLPDRPPDGHKGTFGTVVVLAGSYGFTGAAYLAAMGAARGGAGLVRLCVPNELLSALAVKCTEVMAHPLPDGGTGAVGEEAVEALLRDHLPRASALVVGPGLGRALRTEAAMAVLLARLTCPTVLDADALNIIAARSLRVGASRQPLVVTPHPAEMGRLAHMPTDAVQADRHGVAAAYAQHEGVVVVLKGSRTVVAAPDGRLHEDGHQVVALASGGTGDVLAGLLGSLLGTGLPPFEAAIAAVTIHAEAGEMVQAVRGRAGALASDVLDTLPAAQERLRRALERLPATAE